ncbi:MAG TPA: metallophosphoesterase [Gemmataceae bacterium]|nr:metallophosphoesterase [Gemmataceae bacterium]
MSRLHVDWLLTAERAAVHQPSATAVIADVHLGYHTARARSGEAIPSANWHEALAPLAALVKYHAVRRLVVAGDLFEAGWDADLLQAFAAGVQRLGLVLAGVVPGNHDRLPKDAGSSILIHPQGVRLGRWQVVHGDCPLPAGPSVLGHFHPCVRWPAGPAASCFLVSGQRIVLPAFSGDAAGVNILGNPAWATYECHVIAGRKVLNFGLVGRLPHGKSKIQSRKTKVKLV